MIASVLNYKTSFLQIPELTWSPFRGRDRPEYLLDGNAQNIAKHWAGISTGIHNQDVSFMLEGPKGTGKSSSSLMMCVNSAKWSAEFLGTDWRDHFELERTAAIVDPDKADEVMVNTQKYDVRLFDDISLAWGNRNWQSDENKDKNDIFIINRIDNTINILTSPNSKLIDVVPRSNVNFKGEMDTPYFVYGHTSLKIFKPIPMYRASGYKMLDPYMRVGRNKIVLYMLEQPPKRLIDAYDKERSRATEAIKKNRKEKLEERRGGEPASSVKKARERKPHYGTVEMEQRVMEHSKAIMAVRKEGGDLKAVRRALVQDGVPEPTASKWTKRNGPVEKLFPGTS
jgi:hypothetical protein